MTERKKYRCSVCGLLVYPERLEGRKLYPLEVYLQTFGGSEKKPVMPEQRGVRGRPPKIKVRGIMKYEDITLSETVEARRLLEGRLRVMAKQLGFRVTKTK